ncbi:MAG: DUF998 domain-containing protein, partial [Actinomycetota bacterium]|nr:DUF998 domain-containing protein [Actinomycetota bacterium]
MVGRLAAVAIGGQLVFVLSWLVAQTLEPGYDIEGEQVSALAAETADNPWIVTLGLLAWAAGTAACGETLRRALPRRRLWWTAVAALW